MIGTVRRGRTLRRTLAGAALAALAVGMVAAATPASAQTPSTGLHTACSVAGPGAARCLAEYRATGRTRHDAMRADATPDGFGAKDLRAAYGLPAQGGTGTVAIVDAYGYPTAAKDLAAYRKQYGLPACTVQSGCLRIVNQQGDTSPLPEPDSGWGVETALDLQLASAACPSCRLLLVQGDDASLDALGTSVDTAVRLGASVVSNSYGTDEFNGMSDYAHYYQHSGVPITVSSGDAGFVAASFPAVLTSTIAVGGTTLTKADNARGWSESAWSGAGSGCSAYIDKPSWQRDENCSMRTVADVSAVADPATGVAVYDTYGLGADAGWLVVGGTSAASPFVAGVIALAGHPSTVTPKRLYGEPTAFHDAVGGSNGYCGGDYLCTGVQGYDGPTGLGTPKGVTPFE
ncbi:peptidase S8 [Actinocatenispora thailandica]|uniref:Peptidase S8 n=1 Tax=Actinocatenispora thailandica TaxID=227318 RepID=A0A7R7DVH0_9ACTN|nr:S53 family peptidase [Actinocatenispora thailandica]BCJ38411.1 peptidase S8 [Actinocatenispora thailandica]